MNKLDKHDLATSLADEIASRQSMIFSFGGMMLSLPSPDPVLKRLGKDIEVYREIMNDPVIKGAVRRRRSAVVALEYGLEQGKASDKTMKLCQEVLAKLKLRGLIRELHDASWFGYSPAEIYWERTGSLWLPSKVVGKPPEWFGFDEHNELCLKQFGKLTRVPPMKFITARNDPTFANPYGVADLASVYWLSVFRKGGLKFWLRFVDKYGQAFVVGKHPRATPQTEVDKILDSLEMLSQDGVAVIPNDGSVEILESSGKGATADMFERLLKHCRDEINIALLGQNQSTDASSTNASAQAGIEVTDDIRDADGVMISEAINELLSYVVALNIGESEPVPVWSMWETNDETERLTKLITSAKQAGATVLKPFYTRHLGFADDEILVPEQAGGNNENLAFNEFNPIRKDYADHTTGQLATNSQPIINDWLSRIKAVIDTATSLDEVPDLIINAFNDLPDDKLVDIIQLAMTAGQLAGMAEVVAENE